VVFLDVQMPGLSGFQVARRVVDRQMPTHVVFVTAYDQRAVEAFEVNAVDYLLKPVDPVRLEQAVERARGRIASARSLDTGGEGLNQQLEKVFDLVAERQRRRERLAIKVGERFVLVQSDDIIYASLAEEAITVVTSQLVGTSNCRTLDDLHERLDPNVFWRVHRSHLVNINKIREIVPWFRNYILRMKDDKSTEIPVSRAHTRRIRDYLEI
jgi:two-component system, LytTR family, response regulator